MTIIMHIDYSVSADCINNDSYGMICLKCGCCSRNPDYRDMVIHRIRYYKELLNEQYSFNNWNEGDLRKRQEKVVESNILYFKRKIRRYKKILRCLKSAKKCKKAGDKRDE